MESELISKKSELDNAKDAILKLEDLVKKLTESNEDHIGKLKLVSCQFPPSNILPFSSAPMN